MINELLKKRYSPRAFADKNIEPDKITGLLEAARWSPSSMNGQPWRFIVAEKNDASDFNNLLSVVNEHNQVWAKNAAALILTIVKLDFDFNGQLNIHALYDLGNAVANLTFQATSENLFVRQMGGFYPEKARKVFSIPEGYQPVSILAIGYKGNPEMLPEDLKIREKAVRIRKGLDEIAFTGKFGKPYNNVEQENNLRKAG
ncbi:MAG: nitroreductase family protein [Ignavibacteriaceae bacterium]|nr:nitroreductase family protein [Ignavibacteriaceae bacterium]